MFTGDAIFNKGFSFAGIGIAVAHVPVYKFTTQAYNRHVN